MTSLNLIPPALPINVEDWERITKIAPSLVDLVEHCHLLLLADEERKERYTRFLYSVDNRHAVTGSLWFDRCFAAQMIQEKALQQDKGHPLGRESLATIAKKLAHALNRYGQGWAERRAAATPGNGEAE